MCREYLLHFIQISYSSEAQLLLLNFLHWSMCYRPVARNGSNVIASLGPAAVIGEVRGHSRGIGNHIYQQSVSSSSLWNNHPPFAPPVRRMRVRGGLTPISSIAGTASSSAAEIGGFYGFSVSGSVSRSHHQDGERHHMDRFYGWGGREGGVTPLPWIPVEGESQWWGPFNPNSNSNPNPSQPGGSFAQRASNAERVQQSHPENIYPRMPPPPPPPRMPPFMWGRVRDAIRDDDDDGGSRLSAFFLNHSVHAVNCA